MSEPFRQKVDLIEQHEEILERRAELLEQMESGREQLNIRRKQQMEEAEAAHRRNKALLEDLKKIEDRLTESRLKDSDLVALKKSYWKSVEESFPAWENFLLGKGPHPTDAPEQPTRTAEQKQSTATVKGRPPRPKPRSAR